MEERGGGGERELLLYFHSVLANVGLLVFCVSSSRFPFVGLCNCGISWSYSPAFVPQGLNWLDLCEGPLNITIYNHLDLTNKK